MTDKQALDFFQQLATFLLANYCNGYVSIPKTKWLELEKYEGIAHRFNLEKEEVEVQVVGKDKAH